jgi:hypothetical protein
VFSMFPILREISKNRLSMILFVVHLLGARGSHSNALSDGWSTTDICPGVPNSYSRSAFRSCELLQVDNGPQLKSLKRTSNLRRKRAVNDRSRTGLAEMKERQGNRKKLMTQIVEPTSECCGYVSRRLGVPIGGQSDLGIDRRLLNRSDPLVPPGRRGRERRLEIWISSSDKLEQ